MKTKPCEICEGTGYYPHAVIDVEHPYMTEQVCMYCNGRGEIAVEVVKEEEDEQLSDGVQR